MSDSIDPIAEELYKSADALGWIEGVADIERLLLISVRMLNASEKWGNAFGSAYLASTMSVALDILGRQSLVERYYQIALEYSQYTDPMRLRFQLEWSRALHYNIQADFSKSIQHALRAAEVAQNTGALRSWGAAMDMITWAHISEARLTEAVNTGLEMIEVAEEGSDKQILSWGLLGLGVTRRRLGQIDQAIDDLERAIEVAGSVPDYHSQVAASGWLGNCYVAIEEIEVALSRLKTGQELLEAQGIILEIPILGDGLSETYLAAAEQSTGKERQRWLKKAKYSCRDTLKAARRYRPPLQAAQRFQGQYEWLQGNKKAAEKWWGKALQESQRKRDRYEEGVIHLEIGRFMGDPEHLRNAESILDEIGAEFDLAKAREALENLGES